ncbi:MAG: hypothetical protein H8E36_09000 [Rhodospirillaceae bacterium]|nr:hypothetical protein [Rhodospirillaceae bacterium]
MSKPPAPPTEQIHVGQARQPEPQRAEIFMPGQGNTYGPASQGGVTTAQVKPAAKPVAKKRTASQITGIKADVKPKEAAKKPKKDPPVPGRKIPAKTKKRVPAPEEQTQQLAQSVVSSFTSRLTEEANAKGGYLSVQDLESLNKEFEQKTTELKATLDKSFEDYVSAREKASWDQSRKYPFDRMIVKTFSYMLESDSRKLRRSDSVSRRILPGFFMALSMILGADQMEAYQGKCRAVVMVVKKAYGDKFEWEDIYESDDARAIVIDALVDIAHSFDDIDKRAIWFIDMVNSHLPPTDDEASQTEAEWTLTVEGFKQFFRALMSDLTEALESEGGRLLITRRHGVEETVEMVALMKSLMIGLKGL